MDRPIETLAYYAPPLPAETRAKVVIPLMAVLIVLCGVLVWMRFMPH